MHIRHTCFKVILTILFLLVPLYYKPNLGGIGLHLPYNILAWAVASFIIGSSLYLLATEKKCIRPVNTWAFLVFPAVIMLSGIVTAPTQPISWLFRQIYVVGGILFLFSLFQFNTKQQQVERILYVIVASTFINALIAITQIFSPELIHGWLLTSGNTPMGTFQQINVLSSYLATGTIISFYLISRPSIISAPPAVKALLITSIGSSAFIIAYIGSRVGIMSATIGIILLLISRRRQLKKKLALTLIASLALIGGAIPGGTIQELSGFEKLSQRTIDLARGADFSARTNMYAISLELIAQKPVLGHGIGNFQRVWRIQASDYFKRNPNSIIPTEITNHPHNELMHWLIEGGGGAFIGIVIAIGAILLALIRCGPQRGGAYAALLIPISLHTQVEMPFYISSVHWFLWLFLIFLILRHRTIVSTVPLSLPATRLIKVTAISFCIGTSYFMIHCARAQSDIVAYMTAKDNKGPYLQIALNNLYFKPFAEELTMQHLLRASIQDNNHDKVKYFTQWAERLITVKPNINIFKDLITAYTFLGFENERCRITHTGVLMHPTNESLRAAAKPCDK